MPARIQTIIKIFFAIAFVVVGLFVYRGNIFKPVVVNDAYVDDRKVLDINSELVSFSVAPHSNVSGVVTATGSIKGGYFFEGQAQGFLLNINKNEIKKFPVTAVGDWMTSEPVSFTATFDATGVPSDFGYIRIANDNPSGDISKNKYVDIPVFFK